METIYPIFKKDTHHWYKIIDEENAIQVFNGYSISIIEVHATTATMRTGDCSEADFLEVFYQVRKKLNQICDINFDLL